MRYFAVIALVALISACSRPEPIERVVRVPQPVSPPAALLRCQGAPVPPDGEYTQADVAEYVLDLSEAGEDCREKLGAVRRYVDDAIAD